MPRAYLNILLIISSLVNIVCFNGFSQSKEIDSLLIALNKTSNDTIKIKILQKLTDELMYSDPDSSLTFINHGLNLSKENNYFQGIINAHLNLGTYYFYKSDYTTALEYLSEALNISLETKNIRSEGKVYNNIGIVYASIDANKQALTYFQKALKISEQLKKKDEMASTYSNIGILHERMENHVMAEKYYNLSLQGAIELNDSFILSYTYNNLGGLYSKTDKTTKAKSSYVKALNIFKQINNRHGMSTAYNNLGMVFLKNNEFDSALHYLSKSYIIKKDIGDKKGITTVLNNKAEACYAKAEHINNESIKNKLLKNAHAYASEALEIAKQLNVLSEQQKAYMHLANIYSEKKDFQKAFNFNKKYIAIKDSLVSIEKIKEIANTEALYQVEKKEIQIENLKKEKHIDKLTLQRERSRSTFLLFGIGFFILLVIVLFIFISRIRKKNRIIKSQNDKITDQYEEILEQNSELRNFQEHLEDLVEERTAKLSEAQNNAAKADKLKSIFLESVSHEIRTPLNAIIGFSAILENEENLPKQAQFYVEKIIGGSDNLLRVVDDILQISKIQAGELSQNFAQFNPLILLKEVYGNFKNADCYLKNEKVSLKLNIEAIDNISLKSDKKSIEKILRRLTDNAIKFTDEGIVELGVSITSNQSFCFYVKDTGIGINKKDQPYIFERFRKAESNKNRLYSGVGLGLTISKHLADLINAKLWFQSERGVGSTFFLEFTPESFKK